MCARILSFGIDVFYMTFQNHASKGYRKSIRQYYKTYEKCLYFQARDIGRIVRHSSQCKLTDADLQDIFTTLTNLLSDPTCLAQDVAAQDAVKKLAKVIFIFKP
ncbi:hypothetical protein DPMN_142846 [Dreissena polymorpha]|uniref:Uncharacterized protein n=1 Tax=Dreissena polymorpha TaxID=45954 RepID=A0A9D4GG34_DREPO|nr:hypothetical protein DPMN_142846 [Dreissena polymorpha]